MPGVIPPSGDYFQNQLREYRDRIRALEQQQNFGIRDGQGNLRVQGGLLQAGFGGAGEYGIVVADVNGTALEILPIYWQEVAALELTTSPTYTDLTTPGPTVTAIIGHSGSAMVTISTYMGVNGIAGSQAGGRVSLAIDGGAAVGDYLYYSISSAAGDGIAGNQSTTIVLSGLAPGSHTFEMKYSSFNGGTTHFMTRFLQVRPF